MVGTHEQMGISRRTVLGALATGFTHVQARGGLKAIAFDGFVIFDPRPIAALARSYFPQQGEILASQWSAKLFGHTWFCTAAGHYEDFESLADKSLLSVAETLQLNLPKGARAALVGVYSRLDVWPDVKPALAKLRGAAVRLALLSNLSESMLVMNARNAGIAEQFDQMLSTDRVRRFKPAPAAYHMAIDSFGLAKGEIGFAAFGGWDAAGAGWFGYRTSWVNRLDAANEGLGPRPAIVSRGIEGVLALAGLD